MLMIHFFFSVGEDFDDVDDDENIEELDQPEVKSHFKLLLLSNQEYFPNNDNFFVGGW